MKLKVPKSRTTTTSLSSQAYKLFSDRKTPLEVAIALNLRVRGNYILQRVLQAKTTT